MKMQKGFTLIEILIAMAIIGLLSIVALPVYENYVTSGKLIEATTNLSDAKVRMEQSFMDNRGTYDGTGDGVTCPVSIPAASKYFVYTCAGLSNIGFTVIATGTGSAAGFVYSIDQANTRATLATPAGWGGGNPACWITKKGGSC